MAVWTRRQAFTGLGVGIGAGAVLPLLGGCTDGSSERAQEPGDQDARQDQQEQGGPGPEDVVTTREVVTGFARCEVAVHPLVRRGEHCVLTLDLTTAELMDGEESIRPLRFEGHATPVHANSYTDDWAALRLIDAGGAAIRLPATTADGAILVSSSEGASRIQLLYAAPEDGVEALGLLLPGWYVESVPLIEAEVPAGAPGSEGIAELAEEIELALVLPLEGYSRQFEGQVQVIESEEELQIDLAGDVLFDSSSSEIDARADAALDTAAATITSYESGVVDVVGHTDDVGGDDENQTLSENRAVAVVEALSDRLDTALYELRPEGRGESEPLYANETDEKRRLNRRVTLTLVSRRTTEVEVDTEGELPPFDAGPLKDGAQAAGPEGFERGSDDDHRYHVSAPTARRVDGMLEVTVLGERLPGSGTGSYGSALSLGAGVYSYRGDGTGYSSDNAGFAPRLLLGTTATYPLDYELGPSAIDGHVEWRNASDTSSRDDASPGDDLRFVALYRDVPGVDALVVDQPFVLGIAPYRFTGIPIVG